MNTVRTPLGARRCGTRVIPWWLACVALLCTTGVAVAVVDACISPPQLNRMGFRPGTTVSYYFIGSGFTAAQKNCVQSAINAWNAANASLGLPQFVPWQSGSVGVTFNKVLLGGTTAGNTSNATLDNEGYATQVGIQITTDTNLVERCSGFTKVALHELGHAQALADTHGTGGSSIMNQLSGKDDGGGNIPTLPTSCDKNAVASSEPADPCEFGCPPGYTNVCQGDQQPDPSHCDCCINYTPVLLDLAGDGFRMSNAADGIRFTINANGSIAQLGWPLGTDDGWLVLDRNANGVVDNGSELFGNTTLLRDGSSATNGFIALAELDSNADGAITPEDDQFDKLSVWTDLNRNGVSERSELRTLRTAGVTSISLDYRENRSRDRWGNQFRFASHAVVNGRRVRVVDVIPVSGAPASCIAR